MSWLFGQELMCIKGWQKNFVPINNVTFCCFFFLTTNKCVLSVAGKEINKAFENSISPAWFYQLTNIHSLFIKNLTFLHSKIVWCWVRINQYVRYTSYHWHMGGLHLIYLIIRELKSHTVEITAFRLERKSCKGFFFWQMKFPPMRDLAILTGSVTFKLCYNQI